MKALKVFIFGLLYGWFVKSAIDKIYRDNEVEAMRTENASLKEHVRSLEARLQSKSVEAWPASVQGGAGNDDLKVIKGIGPAIEKKLNEAGIHTFDALARLTPEELENILGSAKRLVRDAGSLISQAEKLAQTKNQP